MSLIMTAQGWKQLTRPITMEVWEIVAWNEKTMKYEPNVNGELRCTGTIDHAPAAPEGYRGKLPSPEVLSHIAWLEHEHAEWVERRAAMIK